MCFCFLCAYLFCNPLVYYLLLMPPRLNQVKVLYYKQAVPCRVWADLKKSFSCYSLHNEDWKYLYFAYIFQQPKSMLSFLDFLETISGVLMMQAKTREISSPTGSVWSCTEVHAQHIHTGIYAAGLFGLILIRITEYFFHDFVILWYLQSKRRFKKSCIFKCAVRAWLVRVIALNQLLGMPKLLCIILYFQIIKNK